MIVKFTDFVGKPLQAFLGEMVKTEESASTMVRPPLAPSQVCVGKVWGGIPLGDNHRRTKSCPIGQEGRPPFQRPTLNVMGRTWQNGTTEQARRGGLELSPCSAMARDSLRKDSGGRASQDPCGKITMLEVNSGSQSLRA